MGDELEYGFLMPFFPAPPIAALILQAVLAVWLVHMSVIAWIFAPAWIIAGIIIYFTYSKSRVKPAEHEIHIFDEVRRCKPGKHPVMVAVANPDNAVNLVNETYRFCEAFEGANVELIHMVPVPDNVPLSDADKYMDEGREAITEAMLYLSMHFPLNTTIRYCRNIARGIVSAVKEKKVRLLVLGWHGEAEGRSGLFNLGSTIDPIIERSPCNVVVMKDDKRNNEKYNKVLVPVAGGPNSAFAVEVATILAEDDAEITLLTIDRGSENRFDIDQFAAQQAARLNRAGGFTVLKVQSKSTVIGIIRSMRGYDLTVLGTTNRMFSPLRGPSIPEKIAIRTKQPVAIVKSGDTVHSRLRRFF